MSYDYAKFVHLVPVGYTVPEGTEVRSANKNPPIVEAFFVTTSGLTVFTADEEDYYLTYDITKPKLPTKINSVIYNVRREGVVYPVAVFQGPHLWSAFNNFGERRSIFSAEIESFDTTPLTEEAES